MIEKIRINSLFSSLSDEQLTTLIEQAQHHKLEQGENLFMQGDAAQHFYWVESGMTRLYRMAPNGDEKVIEIIRPGQTFAEAIMFMDKPQPRYPVSAQMIAKGEVWGFDNQLFLDLLRDSPEGCFRMMANMSHKLHTLVKEIDRLTLQTASERVINYLLQELVNQPQANGELTLSISKQMLAAKLSIKPETLSRTLGRLTREELISSHGNHIRVLDITALRQQVEV